LSYEGNKKATTEHTSNEGVWCGYALDLICIASSMHALLYNANILLLPLSTHPLQRPSKILQFAARTRTSG